MRHRLTAWTRTGTGAGSAVYGYDSAGNLTTATVSRVTTVFAADAENRLTRSVTGSVTTTYTNDLFGRSGGGASGGAGRLAGGARGVVSAD